MHVPSPSPNKNNDDNNISNVHVILVSVHTIMDANKILTTMSTK